MRQNFGVSHYELKDNECFNFYYLWNFQDNKYVYAFI